MRGIASAGALIFFTTDGSRVHLRDIGKATHFYSRPFKLEAGRRMIKAVAVSKCVLPRRVLMYDLIVEVQATHCK